MSAAAALRAGYEDLLRRLEALRPGDADGHAVERLAQALEQRLDLESEHLAPALAGVDPAEAEALAEGRRRLLELAPRLPAQGEQGLTALRAALEARLARTEQALARAGDAPDIKAALERLASAAAGPSAAWLESGDPSTAPMPNASSEPPVDDY